MPKPRRLKIRISLRAGRWAVLFAGSLLGVFSSQAAAIRFADSIADGATVPVEKIIDTTDEVILPFVGDKRTPR